MPEHDERGQAAADLRPGDCVRITAGTFENFEAQVDAVDPASRKVSAMLLVGFSIKWIDLRDAMWQWQKI